MDEMYEKAVPSTGAGEAWESAPAATSAWAGLDIWIIGALILVTLYFLRTGVAWGALPAEDALMLMRYANHVAAGHGIVWNVGDKPVEGATDFLYLIVLSGWIKISHLGAVWASRTLLAFCQIVGVVVLYGASRRIAGAGRFTAAVLACYLASGPGITHVGNGFSSPFYGLLALAAWCFALETTIRGTTTARCAGFAGFALLAGLTRPDGVFLAIFMTAALLYFLRGASFKIVLTTIAVFVVLGGAYFAWRFHYFGYLLPNPFYKKGGGHLYTDSLHISISNVLKMLTLVLPVFLAGLLVKETRRLTIFSLIPVLGFASIWVLLTNENNAGMRFQYVVLPFSLLSAAAIVARLEVRWRTCAAFANSGLPRWSPVAGVLLLLVSFYLGWHLVSKQELVGTGPYHIAKGLSQFEDRHYTIVVTEAGVIPYFSKWRAIDAWGLNDSEIVHNQRGLTPEYLDANHPAIIMFYTASVQDKASYDRIWRGDEPKAQTLQYLEEVASHYALTHGYMVAARWGESPCENAMWYLRKDLPEYEQMLAIIRAPGYFHPYNDAQYGTNYLGSEPPAQCEDTKDVIRRGE